PDVRGSGGGERRRARPRRRRARRMSEAKRPSGAQPPRSGATPIQPRGCPQPKGYSNGMLAPAGSRVLAIAGQIGWDEQEKLVSADFTEQFAKALENVRAVLTAAGGKPEHLLRLTFYVTDKEEYRRACKTI